MGKIYLLSDYQVNNPKIKILPVFKIEYLPKEIDFSNYDGIIFTSKNTIYSIDSFNSFWKNLPSYAIAKKTASIINKLGGKVEFVGKKSHGDDFAEELIDIVKGKKLIYLRAKKIVSNLVSILNDNGIKCEEEIIYETKCIEIKNENLEKNSIFIFTSPSTIECFFKNFNWDKSFRAIAIGKTTAKYLPKNINYKVSNIQSIEACIELAIRYINDK